MTILNAPHSHYAPHFETHDLALAAYMRCLEYPLIDVRRENGGRCVFVLLTGHHVKETSQRFSMKLDTLPH